MFWNLVAVNYERYHLHHLVKIGVLIVYSFMGAGLFMLCEAEHEKQTKNEDNMRVLRTSIAAKQVFVQRLQDMYFNFGNTTGFSETRLRKVLSEYDAAMGITIDSRMTTRWDIWGGLYYAGTIYTTIGYGDLAAVTIWGRICTMLYAMIGIPIVINILNDWGNMLFYFVDHFWQNIGRPWVQKMRTKLRRRKVQSLEEGSIDKTPLMETSTTPANPDGTRPIPLLLVLIVLFFWMTQCVAYFAYFENWTFFESVYFFFISMTTIGFGDFTPNHSVAVGGIVFILGGLSVVSMCINVIQMQLEYLFNQIVQRIENDFKTTLSVAAEESRKKSIGVSEFGSIDPSKKKTMRTEGDVAQKYSENMEMGNKLLMRFMSNHQKKMLNEKFDERAKMRNSGTQTTSQIKVASVQTADRYEQTWDEDPEETQPKSRINTRRLYIYNTGE
ncbi:CBN-TWK-42 protein [Caenorhabditis brenneri]|uniref:CBN-TWK-42 protein n=1 Tax=Caenorhabditis brenneri TaxID=135651 RepID=G0N0S2_CAEBE|nr:CBN-TWK-42 protein [Caenorhabditis brenneri]